MNKKGIFFTIIAVVLVGLGVLFFNLTLTQEGVTADELRIAQLNNFFKEMDENYLERALHTSSHHTFEAMLDMVETGGLIVDFDTKFSEIVQDGQYYDASEDLDVIIPSMEDKSFYELIDKITIKAEDVYNIGDGLDVGIVASVGVSQSHPWFLDVETNVSMNVTGTVANFTVNKKIVRTRLDVNGFRDPMHIDEFGVSYIGSIQNTSTEEIDWGLPTFDDHVTLGTYVYSGGGPSFLMRLTDPSQSSSCCGIESILDGVEHSGPFSSVDYELWRDVGCASVELFSVSGVTNGPVYLKSGDVTRYGLGGSSSSHCVP